MLHGLFSKSGSHQYMAMSRNSDFEFALEDDNRSKLFESAEQEAESIAASGTKNSIALTIAELEDGEYNKQYRTCSWLHTAGLMLSEYIVLAIMSFPWSYSVLGLVPGLILTVFVASTVLYTGLIIAEFCEKYPHLQNVCDIGQFLLGGYKWAWYATAVCFLLNNLLIQGLHVLVGAKYLNTITNHSICTVGFSGIVAGISLVFSLPRTFSSLSFMGYFAAATMFIAVLLSMIFAGVQSHPYQYDGTPVVFRAFPAEGTTFVSGMGAFLNIVYSFVGQVTYPQFIAEMRNPKDFKKVLWIVTTCEVIIFGLAGSIIYVYVGDKYMTAPAFGSLQRAFKIIAFSFAVPTIVYAGALYANVTAKFVLFSLVDRQQKYRFSRSLTSWLIWVGILSLSWAVAFVIAEVIPFFSDLLSLMSSLFDCWFGFVFWGIAYIRLRKRKYGADYSFGRLTLVEKLNYVVSIGLIGMGVYILGPGLYASVQSIILSYQADLYGTVFSCASNGI
ncbi:hypothetical protein BZL39_E00210 [Zygosaccharomyces parabailii]|uniref:BN860_16446g1_1 n=1 Tax=Zygosaccharomyces bailii (strain CLIB 213 / ATCC 58445 / CBS 680 / BCRC 21525 / NBRC 1098 / NCYC 1416 / NRRL Y-2227) TaxID=1333698 RepID=A0A8J2T5Z1_ZYGB2|nr:hypothetical protein BZL39_E00210 [Zygosaccharomyces parabailii]CDF88701.1 BN860_16446g1_1 [Zygosaccharomyces bailii CLIB 213]CDH13248.1 related to neutral amino acid permease [Zygosaccharomyces bailii ISA1307]